MAKKSLWERALGTMMHSRFVARADDLGHTLTDDEVRAEAKYLLETVPYGGMYEGEELHKAMRQMLSLMKK